MTVYIFQLMTTFKVHITVNFHDNIRTSPYLWTIKRNLKRLPTVDKLPWPCPFGKSMMKRKMLLSKEKQPFCFLNLMFKRKVNKNLVTTFE